MTLFGRSNEIDIDIRTEYMQQQKGLISTIKPSDGKQTK
jgi:hypothetical protein